MIMKCLEKVDYSDNPDPAIQKSPASAAKNLQYKLFILVYITQNGSMLKHVDNLNILPFLMNAYKKLSPDSKDKEATEDVILSIMANMAFEESLQEKIIKFEKLNEVFDKINKKKRDVLRLLANLTLSKSFDVSIIMDYHIDQAFDAIRNVTKEYIKDSMESYVNLTSISCLCVILNLTSKGLEINKKFLNLNLTKHLCNIVKDNISDQKVVPLSFMILANLMTYEPLVDQVMNDTVEMLRIIHDTTYIKLKKDTKYNLEDKIFSKVFFLLAYSRFNLNCLLQGQMEKLKNKLNIERYFEVFLEIFLSVDLSQNNLILISGRIIYYMILHNEKLYDFLMKKEPFFKRLIQIIAGPEYEMVIKGKLDVFSNGINKERIAPLIAHIFVKSSNQEEFDISNSNQPQLSVSKDATTLDDKEKAASQSRMISLLLLRLISKKEKSAKLFFIYRGLDNLVKYIFKLFQTARITEDERESIILFYASIISTKQIQEKLKRNLSYMISSFQTSFAATASDSILIACMHFFLHLSKNSVHHQAIAKRKFLQNVTLLYKRPNRRLKQLIQILLSTLSFTNKVHPFMIKAGCHTIIEDVDETDEELRHYMNVSKLNLALNHKTFMLLQNAPGVLTSLPLMSALNPVGQIKLYLAALQYLIKDGPFFLSPEAVPDMFHDFVDPTKEAVSAFAIQENKTEAEKKPSIVHVLTICFRSLTESLTSQSVYIITRVVYLVLVLLDHPYLEDVSMDTQRLLMVEQELT